MKSRAFCRMIAVLGVCATSWQVTGCTAHGHRRTEVSLGTTFRFEDEVRPDETGKQDYKVSFDDQNNIVGALFGWLFSPAQENSEAWASPAVGQPSVLTEATGNTDAEAGKAGEAAREAGLKGEAPDPG